MKKKLLALILAGVLVLSLAACGGNNGGSSQDPGDSQTGDTQEPETGDTGDTGDTSGDGQVYNIGICQLAPHPALDAATEGFQDALAAAFGEDGVKFDLQNAAGDSATCATIANGFVSAGVDLILANATASLQAAAAATADIPILGTSITEYGVALGIDGFTGTVGGNISGTSDLAPLDQQAAMIKEWFPDAQNVGLLYCSAEPNSQYQVDNVQTFLEEMGLTCTQYPFSDTNDMASVTQNAASNSDVLYVPTDNTCADNTGVIDNICRPAGVPIIAGEEGICGGCGVATLSISYYDIGYKAGEMAADILTGQADISTMAIEYAPQFTKKYNETICTDLNLTVPDGYEAITVE
ncbi:MAG: ABC transporter substrate-binding protein [Oscillibacter sp.]|nr:ABC transporter substrate-binding protein [Oscillibacter sp.]